MNYGIIEEENIVMCANCQKPLSNNGEIPYEFCPDCGSPLTVEAINAKEIDDYNLQRRAALNISEIAKENKTDSVTIAVKKYLEEIK